MRSKIRRIIFATIVATIWLMLLATPTLAISNPDSITFGTGTVARYKVFYNVYETGDMLFIAETYVHYASEPTDYTAEEAFSFNLMSSDLSATYLIANVPEYENKVISIYQTATQVTALGLFRLVS